MIILTTKKLQEYLATSAIPLPKNVNDDALWHGNIFLFQRKKVLQLTHEHTRYTIFIHGITKKDLKDITSIIREHLRYHMLKDKLELKEMTYVDQLSDNFSYFKRVNKQVTGTMNNMRAIYEHLCLSDNEILDKKFSHNINQMIFKIDGEYETPVQLFQEYMKIAVLCNDADR